MLIPLYSKQVPNSESINGILEHNSLDRLKLLLALLVHQSLFMGNCLHLESTFDMNGLVYFGEPLIFLFDLSVLIQMVPKNICLTFPKAYLSAPLKQASDSWDVKLRTGFIYHRKGAQ